MSPHPLIVIVVRSEYVHTFNVRSHPLGWRTPGACRNYSDIAAIRIFPRQTTTSLVNTNNMTIWLSPTILYSKGAVCASNVGISVLVANAGTTFNCSRTMANVRYGKWPQDAASTCLDTCR